MKSNSYNPNACCGADCNLLGNDPNEPCWGDVTCIDEIYDEDAEDHFWLHLCKGHVDCYDGKYAQEGDTQ